MTRKHPETVGVCLVNECIEGDALEAALPRLREMFDQNALQLVRARLSPIMAGRRAMR